MKQQTFPLVKRWLLLLDFTTNSLPPWNVKLYLISYQYDRKWQHSLEQHHRLCIWHLQCYVWEHNSVVSRLKEKIPSIFVMHCICHTAHLCASHACEKLPSLDSWGVNAWCVQLLLSQSRWIQSSPVLQWCRAAQITSPMSNKMAFSVFLCMYQGSLSNGMNS